MKNKIRITARKKKDLEVFYKNEKNYQNQLKVFDDQDTAKNGIWGNRLSNDQERKDFSFLIKEISSDLEKKTITKTDHLQIEHLALMNVKFGRAIERNDIPAISEIHRIIRNTLRDLLLTRKDRNLNKNGSSPADFAAHMMKQFFEEEKKQTNENIGD